MENLFWKSYSCVVFILGGILTVFAVLLFSWAIVIPVRYRVKYIARYVGIPLIAGYCKIFLNFPVYRNYRPGTDSIFPEGPYAMISNHLSLLDIPLLIREFGVLFLMKSALKFSPFGFGSLLLGAVAVDRRSMKARGKALTALSQRLRQGGVMHVFPEGTRSRDGELLPFHRGLLAKLYYENIPVVACGIWGTQFSFPPERLYLNGLKPAAITVRGIIEPGNYAKASDFTQACRQAVQEALDGSKSKLAEKTPNTAAIA